MLTALKNKIPSRIKMNLKLIIWRAVDYFDLFYRLLSKQSFLPPYSLRMYIGGSKGFREGGAFFTSEFIRHGLLKPNMNILDVGCGSGRVAYTLASNPNFRENISQFYGMDIDQRCINWCQKNISKKNQHFHFYCPDLLNIFYNPNGKSKPNEYVFPHASKTFDLIFLTSVFTHLLDAEVRNFCKEFSRILRPDGKIYTTFFTYKTQEEAANPTQKRPVIFPHFFGNYALADLDLPEAAVAYQGEYLSKLLFDCGLEIISVENMLQDVYILKKVTDKNSA